MTSLTLYQDTALTIQEDMTYRPCLVPGNEMYERLLLQDPKKLKRMIREEQQLAKDVNTPAYQKRMREYQQQSAARLADDIASGKFAKRAADFHRARQGRRSIAPPTPDDHALLGLDANASLTKRDVKNAYRRKARKLHPDVGGDAEAFNALHTAYRIILAATTV